jgi:CBS domain-containing protein
MNLHVSSTQATADGFVCRDTDTLWTAIERALDNGFGLVFVTGGDGEALGRLTLGDLRQALREGAHLGNASVGGIVGPYSLDDADSPVAPVLDARGRIVGIGKRPDAAFLPVAEPDLSHAELRNLMDAFLSTWISSTGDYITRFETSFAARTGMNHGVATANGTVSLHLALAALGIGPGDEVIGPDLRRLGQCRHPSGRHAGYGRCRSADMVRLARDDRARDHAAHAGGDAGACVRPAGADDRNPRSRAAARPVRHRGLRGGPWRKL